MSQSSKKYRIGIGGIAIESSTFSPLHSTIADFTIKRGQEMVELYPFMPNWNFRGRDDIEWLPAMKARSLPAGSVVQADYLAMKNELLERIKATLPLDGFVFDIHGAMNVVGMDDAEGDLIAAIRELVGPDCIISAGMDLHGNVTARLVENVNIFTAYRLAPHDDALETRERSVAHLLYCLDNKVRPMRAWVRIPVILPGERTSTLVEPGKSVYASLKESDPVPGVLDASLWVGYVWADEPRASATAVVTGTDAEVIKREAEKIAKRYWDARFDFDMVVPFGTAEWCIEQAVAFPENGVIISDSGDNPTAGGANDTPCFAAALLADKRFASGELTAITASIADPAAVKACYAAGVGGEVEASLGGKLDPVNAKPLPVKGTVYSLFPNDPVGGDLAVLKVGGVHIILTSRRKPYHFISEFTKLGLDPKDHKLTGVKIGYLEPDLRRYATKAFLAVTPGAVNQGITSLDYKRVIRPIFPLDQEFEADLTATIFQPIA
jgi:Uncharacterized conserved protein